MQLNESRESILVMLPGSRDEGLLIGMRLRHTSTLELQKSFIAADSTPAIVQKSAITYHTMRNLRIPQANPVVRARGIPS